MTKLTLTDRKILAALSQNARVAMKDVASECGLSRAAVHQRMQRLVDKGIITGSGFDVAFELTGRRTEFCQFRVERAIKTLAFCRCMELRFETVVVGFRHHFTG